MYNNKLYYHIIYIRIYSNILSIAKSTVDAKT